MSDRTGQVVFMFWFWLILSPTVVGIALMFMPEPYTAKVLYVEDGDTVLVRRDGAEVWIRLADIDAPESGQPYGNEARQHLRKLLGEYVRVDPTGEQSYGRTVAHLGVGRAMVRAGMAWDGYYGREFKHAQDTAQRHDRGLWQQPNPTPPWVWRHQWHT